MPTKEVKEKLEKGFDSKNAAYAGSNIQATVDDQSITLTGTVNSESQKEMAVQLARAYADDRKVIDRLVIPQ
jgi:osmotically-inducible protein OsmY